MPDQRRGVRLDPNNQESSRMLGFRLTETEAKMFAAFAARMGVTWSAALRQVVLERLQAEEEGAVSNG